jgi:growth factor-regulated tyrosine kinase substrate
LSSAYSQHNLGPYGTAATTKHSYGAYPSLSQNAPTGRGNTESYYYGNGSPDHIDSAPPQPPPVISNAYVSAPPSGFAESSPYPPQSSGYPAHPSQTWNPPAPASVGSPSLSNAPVSYAANMQSPPGSNYPSGNPPAAQEAALPSAPPPQRDSDVSYRQSPVQQREPFYQQQPGQPTSLSSPNAPPSTFVYPSQSNYSTSHPQPAITPGQAPPTPQGPIDLMPTQHPQQSNTSYYFPQQNLPPPGDASTHPSTSSAQLGAYPSYPSSQHPSTYEPTPQYQQAVAPRPAVEEALIDL